jgi:glycosyltransferase involved in cell wall biosynthesis
MRIIIDGIVFSEPTAGIAKYYDELLPRLTHFPNTKIDVMLPRSAVRSAPSASAIQVRQSVLPKAKRLPLNKLRRFLSPYRKKIDETLWELRTLGAHETIFHSTLYTLFPNRRIPHVVTVFDMTHEKYRNFFCQPSDEEFRNRKAKSIRHATRITCISETTKKDLVEMFSLRPEEISVIYLAVNSDEFFEDADKVATQKTVAKKHGFEKPFVLQVGGRWGYKNFKTLLEAYASSHFLNDFLLVAAGGAWTEEELALIKKLNIQSNVRLVHSPGVEDLRLLYNACSNFVYPSLAEGFGLPVLEAMACGAPVAVSTGTSLTEVGGNAVVSFSPTDPSEMASAIESLLDSKKAAIYRTRGLERVGQFSWDKNARETFSLWQTALAESPIAKAAGF